MYHTWFCKNIFFLIKHNCCTLACYHTPYDGHLLLKLFGCILYHKHKENHHWHPPIFLVHLMKTPMKRYRNAVLQDIVEEHPDFLSLHTIDRHELQNRGHKKILFSQQSKTCLGMNQHSSKRQMSYRELNKRKWEAVNVTTLLASLPSFIRKVSWNLIQSWHYSEVTQTCYFSNFLWQ